MEVYVPYAVYQGNAKMLILKIKQYNPPCYRITDKYHVIISISTEK